MNTLPRRACFAALAGFCALAISAQGNAAGSFDKTGPVNAITDVDGILVGMYTRTDPPYQTGTTAVWAPGTTAMTGATGGAYVPGGWPGGVNTDVLQPGKRGQRLDAVSLSGGSFFGLATYRGVMDWLYENGFGLQTGSTPTQVDPLVSSAIVYDLGRGGDFISVPGVEFGYEAISRAKNGHLDQGNVGAGTGTNSGGWLRLKAGTGTASVQLSSGVTVGAIVTVNAAGSPVNQADCSLLGTAYAIGNEFARYGYQTPTAAECAAVQPVVASVAKAASVGKAQNPGQDSDDDEEKHPNTTIGVVATDAILTVDQANVIARVANEGHALAVQPINRIGDGDSMFTMATNKIAISDAQFEELKQGVRETWARAVAHAMLNAASIDRTAIGGARRTSYCDMFPSACNGRGGH